MQAKQRGIGIAEVVIAAAILTAGVGALLGVQVSAIESSTDNLRKVEAMQIARDFIENVRTNPSQMPLYFSQSRTRALIAAAGGSTNCYNNNCTPTQKANWDLTEMHKQASARGFQLTTEKCTINTNRECIFVIWGDTTGTVSSRESSGVGGNSPAQGNYCASQSDGKLIVNPEAQCIFLEAF